MAKSRNTESDYGVHVHMLRQRARRPEPKSRKGRENDRRASIERSRRDG